eukprot:COSAG01_NODE_41827_length_446_cov_11.195965_1_plen_20_part_10
MKESSQNDGLPPLARLVFMR